MTSALKKDFVAVNNEHYEKKWKVTVVRSDYDVQF